jgi:hypothetical protein
MNVCYESPQQASQFSVEGDRYAVEIELGSEKRVEMRGFSGGPTISTTSTAMGAMPVTVADFLKFKFSANPNVRALMVGRSDDVHHVWAFLDEWTQEQRKAVYAIQRTVLDEIGADFNFDFYVVDLPHNMRPEEMVSEIPLVYFRT